MIATATISRSALLVLALLAASPSGVLSTPNADLEAVRGATAAVVGRLRATSRVGGGALKTEPPEEARRGSRKDESDIPAKISRDTSSGDTALPECTAENDKLNSEIDDLKASIATLNSENDELISENTVIRTSITEVLQFDVNSPGALFDATNKANTALVKVLLWAGADVNARDRWGATALHYAVGTYAVGTDYASYRGRVAVVEALLAGGADVNAKTKTGLTPCDYAIHRNSLDGDVKALVLALVCPEVLRHGTTSRNSSD